MPADTIETDLTHWPIVIHRTIGIPPDDHVDAFIARADRILGRKQLHVVIFDSSQAGRASLYMRAQAGDWLRRNAGVLNQYCLGTALVFRSAALRFVMTTVMLVISHPVPHSVCRNIEEAMAWSRSRLGARAVGT